MTEDEMPVNETIQNKKDESQLEVIYKARAFYPD